MNGTPVSNPRDLRLALTEDPEQFVQTVAAKMLMYGLGRGIEHYDMPVVRQIVRDAALDGYRFSSLVLGIVNSPPFRMKQVSEESDSLE